MTTAGNGRVDYLHKELQDTRQEMRSRFSRLEDMMVRQEKAMFRRLDRIEREQTERLTRIEGEQKDQQNDIEDIKLWRASSKGAVAALSAIISAIITAGGLALAWIRNGGD